MKKILLFTTALAFLSVSVLAQADTSATTQSPKKVKKHKRDGYIFAKDTVLVEPTPYPEIKPEDVIYAKRIWREVDFRDRGNIILASPKVNFLSVIYRAISNGELELFGIGDESFERDPVPSTKLNTNAKSAVDTAFLGVNPNTNELNEANDEFFAQSFKGIRIKEDWIFDGKRGVFEPRIVGIAPVRLDTRQSVNPDGTPILGPDNQPLPPTVTEQPVGWIYFDDLRQILVNTKIANDGNDKSGLTFDDIFTRRLFFSYITKESSSSDLRIQDLEINGRLLTDKEKLIEAERIKKKLADFEQGLWEY